MYSVPHRQVAMHIYNIVKSLRKAATLANVSHSTIARWVIDALGHVFAGLRVSDDPEFVDMTNVAAALGRANVRSSIEYYLADGCVVRAEPGSYNAYNASCDNLSSVIILPRLQSHKRHRLE